MTKACIVAAATSLPQRYYSQEVLASAMRKYCAAMGLEFELDDINNFFSHVKIGGRYFNLPIDTFDDSASFGATIDEALTKAIDLSEAALKTLFNRQQLLGPQDISMLAMVASFTSAPSIDAHLMNRLPFSENTKRLPIVGLGCMAGAAGLARTADYLAGHPGEAAILTAVELLPSVAWRGSLQADFVELSKQLKGDISAYSEMISTIVGAALFGDGAASVLMVGRDHPLAAKLSPAIPRVIDTRSILLPESQGLMGLKFIDAGVRNILRSDVADFVKLGAPKLLGSLLAAHNLTVKDIKKWIVHPGGPKVIQTIEETFCLHSDALNLSRSILDRVGNISSATVLFMLEEVLQEEPPEPGSYGLLIAMGPGFSQEAVLLQW